MRHHIELRMMLRAIRRMLFEGCTSCFANVLYANGNQYDLALDLEGVHDLKLHHPSSSVATSNQ